MNGIFSCLLGRESIEVELLNMVFAWPTIKCSLTLLQRYTNITESVLKALWSSLEGLTSVEHKCYVAS
jgi:hypothetical protein